MENTTQIELNQGGNETACQTVGEAVELGNKITTCGYDVWVDGELKISKVRDFKNNTWTITQY